MLNKQQRKAARRAAAKKFEAPTGGPSHAEHPGVAAGVKEADPVLPKQDVDEVSSFPS